MRLGLGRTLDDSDYMVVRPQHDSGCGFRRRPEQLKDALLGIEQDRKGRLLIDGLLGSFGRDREKSRARSREGVVARGELGQDLGDGRGGLGTKDQDDRVSRNRILTQIDRRAVELWQHAIRCDVTDRGWTSCW